MHVRTYFVLRDNTSVQLCMSYVAGHFAFIELAVQAISCIGTIMERSCTVMTSEYCFVFSALIGVIMPCILHDHYLDVYM